MKKAKHIARHLAVLESVEPRRMMTAAALIGTQALIVASNSGSVVLCCEAENVRRMFGSAM